MIAGNHEHTFDVANYGDLSETFRLIEDCHEVRSLLIDSPDIVYLEDSGTIINGIHIWGSPWLVNNIECVTVEPPIKDPLRAGHNRNNLSTYDKPKFSFFHIVEPLTE